MSLPVILVTGSNGQLGAALKQCSGSIQQFRFVFSTREDLPLHQPAAIKDYFETLRPAYCINCAAYTAVDKAETDRATAMLVNAEASGTLAVVCHSTGTRLIHISTDYVFDGTASVPYKEEDATQPVNYYGATKLKGEELVLANDHAAVIIRTSWVYSAFGSNFVKTMMRLMKERTSLNVVNDQFGSPTYAIDLAGCILNIIEQTDADKHTWQPGIYHFSNEGAITWYNFAIAIKSLTGSNCEVHPVPTAMFPTPAKRPSYAVMDKQKIQAVYHTRLTDWQTSLAACIKILQQSPA
jgi:dTDP-4-dehydrorhamnose reductase